MLRLSVHQLVKMEMFIVKTVHRGQHAIDPFPDPDQVPAEIDGFLHYNDGVDPHEKYLPSILKDVKKSPNEVPFSPTAQCGFCD